MKIELWPSRVEEIYIAHASTEGYFRHWAFSRPTKRLINSRELDEALKLFGVLRLSAWWPINPKVRETQFVRCYVRFEDEVTGK